MNFIAIDFETANRSRSSICAVGIAIVENGRLLKTEHVLIKPTPNYYDDYNTVLHGIEDCHTRNKNTFKQAWEQLKPYFHNRTIIAHNAAFDCSVLRFTLDDADLPYPDLNYHCTYRLSKATLALHSHKLNEVSSHLKISLKHHDAESDARASALIALRLCEQYNFNSLEEFSLSLGFKIGKIVSENKSYRPFSKK